MVVRFISSKSQAIISTSRRSLPSNLNGIIDVHLISEAVPPFSNGDADELFRAHHIEKEMLTIARVSSLNIICGGHPILLTALARHLLSQPDKPREALLEVILANKHRTEIDLETYRAVFNTVEAEGCRHLLYRLASAGIAMSVDEIRAIAEVEPALHEPTGCIVRLDGLWLRKLANARYDVSPLVTPLGRELPKKLLGPVHRQVAAIIFRRGQIGVSEFFRAITSLLIAGEQNAAATHLIRGCVHWQDKTGGYDDIGISFFFPINKRHRLDPFNELPLRAAQAVSIAIARKDTASYVTRMQTLIANPTRKTAVSAMLAAWLILISPLEKIPMKLAAFGASLIERFRSFPDLPHGRYSQK